MRIETIKYLEWYKTKAPVKYDLCSSGVEKLPLKNLNLEIGELEISGENVYGYIPLLEAIAARYKVNEETVVSAIGTSQAFFLVCAALLDRGDEVLIENPVYEPLLAVPRAFDANVLRLERKFEDNYQFDLERFGSAISSKTKLVVLTNLHNPSNVLLSSSFLKEMTEIALKRGVKVLIDEIYLEFLDENERETSFHLAKNIIVISSLTKVYGLGGLRCGWILAPSELAKRIRRVVDCINVEGVFIGEQISAKAFSQLGSIKIRNNERVMHNRALVRNFIDQEEKLSWVEPHKGIVCFPRVETSATGDVLAALLREKYDTGIVPGSFFEEPQHFRLGFGADPEILAAGLDNIKKALKEL